MTLLGRLTFILGYTLLGCLIAGLYGVLHDQITFAISPEYFTRFKFHQFQLLHTGWPDFAKVSLIGFLATWWVGFIAALILSTLASVLLAKQVGRRAMNKAFGILFACALTAGVIGGVLGYIRRSDPDFTHWEYYSTALGVQDLPAFVNVGYIHNASYLGGVIGLALAAAYLLAKRWP